MTSFRNNSLMKNCLVVLQMSFVSVLKEKEKVSEPQSAPNLLLQYIMEPLRISSYTQMPMHIRRTRHSLQTL